MDLFGNALKDYYAGLRDNKLWIHTDYGQPEEMPVDVYFRTPDEFPELELLALSMCEGSVLDIGAGVGSHALILQQKEFKVTALEISESACQIMKMRGIRKILNTDIFLYDAKKYDTLLLLMNGIGLCEDVNGFHSFLKHMKKLIKPDGQLIFDSSDISYLKEDRKIVSEKYFGEFTYCYEYQNIKGDWFKWLYIDFPTLEEAAELNGWHAQLVYEDNMDQFLVRLTLNE